MTINISDYKVLRGTNRGIGPFSEAYLIVPRDGAKSRASIHLSNEIGKALSDSVGEKVCVLYSALSGVVILANEIHGDTRKISWSDRRRKGGTGCTLSVSDIGEVMIKLFGRHKYYGFNWRFDNASGGDGRVLVLEPNGKWKD